MANISCKFCYEGDLACLAWRTVDRAAERPTQWLVIRPSGEVTTFQVMSKVVNGKEERQQLLVKGTVLGLCLGKQVKRSAEQQRRLFFS